MDEKTIRHLLRQAADELPPSDSAPVVRAVHTQEARVRRGAVRLRYQWMVVSLAALLFIMMPGGPSPVPTVDETPEEFPLCIVMPTVTSPYSDPLASLMTQVAIPQGGPAK